MAALRLVRHNGVAKEIECIVVVDRETYRRIKYATEEGKMDIPFPRSWRTYSTLLLSQHFRFEKNFHATTGEEL